VRHPPNLQAPSASGLQFLWLCAFHAGIAAILVVELLFWLKLNLLQVLPPFVLAEAVTLLLGVKAASMGGARTKEE